MLRRTVFREIKTSIGRWAAILAIIALGVGMFAGLKVSDAAMVDIAKRYAADRLMYDFRIVSTLGFTDDDVAALSRIDGVAAVSGTLSVDFLQSGADGHEYVLKAESLTSGINEVYVAAGRIPERPDECFGDSRIFSEDDIGTMVKVSQSNDEETLDILRYGEYVLTGIGNSVHYMNSDRGTTSLGTGVVSGFIYIPVDGFDSDYYTDIYVRFGEYELYGDEYEKLLDRVEDTLVSAAEERADIRYETIMGDAREELDDAYAELEDAKNEYLTEKADAERELEDARTELADARIELADGWIEYYDGIETLRKETEKANDEIRDAKAELEDAYAELLDGEAEYLDGINKLEDAEIEYADGLKKYEDGYAEYLDGVKEYEDGYAEYLDGVKEYEDGYAEYLDGVKEYEDGLRQYEDGVREFENGMYELQQAKLRLESAKKELNAAKKTLTESDAAYEELKQLYDTVNGLRQQIEYQSGGYLSFGNCGAFIDALRTNPMLSGAVDAALSGTGLNSAALVYAWQTAESSLGGQALTADYLSVLRSTLDKGWSEYKAGRSAYTDGVAQYESAMSEMDTHQLELHKAWVELDDAKKKLADAEAEFADGKRELEDAEAELADGKKELDDAKAELEDAYAELEDARAEIDDGWAELNDARVEIDDGWAQYYDGVQELADAEATLAQEIADAEEELADAYIKLCDGETEYAEGLVEYDEGKAEAEEGFLEAEEKIADAEKELADAEEELSKIEYPSVYVLDRSKNIGAVSFENDTSIVSGISRVFPLFFFLVAALVCITTMTRMIEEQRTQIGVLKAMGYSGSAIIGKYLAYSGSSSIIGCVLGFIGGSFVFPRVLWMVYSIMYCIPYDIEFEFDLPLAVTSIAVYMVCALGATYVSCREELKAVPAELIRPRTPKAGRRILIERFGFIWRRLGFLHKISLRNIFRYKQRLLMMVLGVGGCTALLLTGFGIYDSICGVESDQYDGITLYDYSVSFIREPDEEERKEFEAAASEMSDEWIYLNENSVNVEFADSIRSVTFVTADGQGYDNFMSMRSGSREVAFPERGEAVITVNLAGQLGVSAGDTVILSNDDVNAFEVTVSDIFDNYVGNFVIVSQETYADMHGAPPENKTVYMNLHEGYDVYEGAAVLREFDFVSNVSVVRDIRESIADTLSCMVYIVILVVICAGALAFIVIYNLTNISITERIREIATIKVLGFTDGESAMYVFRENILMALIAAAVGLGLGNMLHAFVLGQVKVDMMYFNVRIAPLSYLYSVVLTVLFAVIVDAVMYLRLRRINMAESLKSIE